MNWQRATIASGTWLGTARGIARLAVVSFTCLAACGHSSSSSRSAPVESGSPQAATIPAAPPAETTGGFDGARAYKHVEQLVAIGPHSAGTPGIRRAQAYIIGQLKSFGCPVDGRGFSRVLHAGRRRGHEKYRGENSLEPIPTSSCFLALRHQAHR